MSDDTGSKETAGGASPDRTLRIERMATVVDEIVEAYVVMDEAEDISQQMRMLAAASRRLWVLATRPGLPRHR